MLAVVVVSTPLALAFETLLRQLLFPPEMDEVRAWLRPSLTPWTWLAPPASAAASVLGVKLYRILLRRGTAKLDPGKTDPDAIDKVRLDALLLATSAPQVPALLATVAFMFGAELTPVLVAMAVATLGVASVGWFALRDYGRAA